MDFVHLICSLVSGEIHSSKTFGLLPFIGFADTQAPHQNLTFRQLLRGPSSKARPRLVKKKTCRSGIKNEVFNSLTSFAIIYFCSRITIGYIGDIFYEKNVYTFFNFTHNRALYGLY